MAYSELEQESTDLDIYFEDENKFVHLASGGGRLPTQIADLDTANENFIRQLNDENSIFDFEINPNLKNLLELDDNGLELYLNDFVRNAKRGFHSYDKTNLGMFEDSTFHLVAKPIFKKDIKELYSRIPNLNSILLPSDFKEFDLNKFM